MSVCGLALALSFLRGQDVMPAVVPQCSGHAELLEDYRVHLARERGLAAGIVDNNLRVAREFLDEAGSGIEELRALTAARLLEILTLLARRRNGYGSAVTTASFIRTLLQFLFATGRVATDLAPAIPRVSSAGPVAARGAGSPRARSPGCCRVVTSPARRVCETTQGISCGSSDRGRPGSGSRPPTQRAPG